MHVFSDQAKFARHHYSKEAEFEADIVTFSKLFFGEKTIYVDAKKKIDSKSLGGAIPDGFFFDFSDANDFQFYLVEVELASHSFFNHIFPQITKFFAFYKNDKQQKALIEKLFAIISDDSAIKKDFKKFLGRQEIYKVLTDLIANSQNILLILDDNKSELPEIVDTYTDTWGRMVKPLVIQKFSGPKNDIFVMDPEYESLDYIDESGGDAPEISEEFHLEKVEKHVRAIYNKIKEMSFKIDPNFVFNPQKYYISIRSNKTVVVMIVRRKKIRIIPMLPEDEIRDVVKHHEVSTLSQGVQNFYNSPCAAIDLLNLSHLDEIGKIIGLANVRVKQD